MIVKRSFKSNPCIMQENLCVMMAYILICSQTLFKSSSFVQESHTVFNAMSIETMQPLIFYFIILFQKIYIINLFRIIPKSYQNLQSYMDRDLPLLKLNHVLLDPPYINPILVFQILILPPRFYIINLFQFIPKCHLNLYYTVMRSFYKA